MNKEKRKDILKLLKSGFSAVNISNQIGLILEQPQEDILRIIQACHWDIKQVMGWFDMFATAKTGYNQFNTGGY